MNKHYSRDKPIDQYAETSNLLEFNTPIITASPWKDKPQLVECPFCNQRGNSLVLPKLGKMNYIVAGVCCILGGWLGCCFIPLMMDSLKDSMHICPKCHRNLGVYHR